MLGLGLSLFVACSSAEPPPEPEREPATAAPSRRTALRLGQCGHVRPGAVRGGLLPAVLDVAGFGDGVPLALDQVQLQPVAGSWFCVLRTWVGQGDPPPPRRPADLGRFELLREERRAIDAAGTEDGERWIYVTDPAWAEALREHRRSLERAPAARRAALCEEVGRARPDADAGRSSAVTAMRHWVATGDLREPAPAPELEIHVRGIVEACQW